MCVYIYIYIHYTYIHIYIHIIYNCTYIYIYIYIYRIFIGLVYKQAAGGRVDSGARPSRWDPSDSYCLPAQEVITTQHHTDILIVIG